MKRFPILIMLVVMIFLQRVNGQILITTPCGITENFDGIGNSATASLPAGWKMSSAGTGFLSNYSTATNLLNTSQAANSGSPVAGGAYNWGTSAAERAIGFMTSGGVGGYSSPNAIMAFYNNATGVQINDLTITFDIERYRTNSATFSLAFFTSTDGTTWTSQTSGDIATSIFTTGTSSYDWTTAMYVTKTIVLTGINIPIGGSFYLKWVFTNTGSSTSQGLGLDNIKLVPSVAPGYNPPNVSSPAVTATNAQATVSWVNPVCYDEIMIVAASSANTGIPVGDGSAYTAVISYTGGGTIIGNGVVVYKGNISPQTITILTNGQTYYFKIFTRKGTIWSSGVEVSCILTAPTDYFRSVASGDWNTTSTWQSSTDGSTGWINSTLIPTAASAGILIQSGHTVSVTSPVSLDQLTIKGTLLVQYTTSSSGVLNINDGTGNDIDIASAGRLKIDCPTSTGKGYTDLFVYSSPSARINVNSGGSITVGNGASIGGGFSLLGTTPSNEVIWNDGAVFEWNTTAPFNSSNATYFPNAGAGTIPVFRLLQNISAFVGANTATTFNGLFEANAVITFQNPGNKVFRNGIIGIASVNQADAGTGAFLITGTAQLGGTGNINLSTNGLSISASSVTTLISDKTINAGPVTINGTLDAIAFRIAGTATACMVNGTVKTSNVNGLSGTVNSTVSNSVSIVSLGNSSTIIYYTSGNQNISARTDYYNVTITGGGVKNLQGNVTISGILSLSSGSLSIGSNTLILKSSILTSTGTLSGNSSSNLTIDNNGLVNPVLNFSIGSQLLHNLTLNAKAIATLGTALAITAGTSFGTVTVNNAGILTTNNYLTLRSDNNGTARVAQNTSGSIYITGKVMIERYIQAFRAWRLITAPISSNQTIKNSWQEGQTNLFTNGIHSSVTYPLNNNPGYGTEITNKIATDPYSTGFDQAVTNNPSILYIKNGAFATPDNTDSFYVNSQPGFMLFVRGDRGVVIKTPPFDPATSTILRTYGTLNEGTKTIAVSSTGYQMIGNPYVSELSLDRIFQSYSSLVGSYYVMWDPLLAGTGTSGVGGYVYAAYTGGTPLYSNFNQNISAFNPGRIESGAAFFLYCLPGSFYIKETDKDIASPLVFRPADNSVLSDFSIRLNTVNADGTTVTDDATLSIFSNEYSDSVNWLEDAPKIKNPAENLALVRNGKALAIEKTKPLSVNDTIFIRTTQLQQNEYQLVFSENNIQQQGLSASLEDRFTNTSTPLSLTDTTKLSFTVISDTGSQMADRFRIVFAKDDGALPVTYTSIKATRQNSDILVQWSAEYEAGINQYEVEKSMDGKSFTKVAVIKSKEGNNLSVDYQWIDTAAITGENFYRIVSAGNNEIPEYSAVVKIKIEEELPAFVVYPNPVKDGIVEVKLTNMPKGSYHLKLLNRLGELITSKIILHPGGSSLEKITFNKNIAKGVYELELIKQDNSIYSCTLFF